MLKQVGKVAHWEPGGVAPPHIMDISPRHQNSYAASWCTELHARGISSSLHPGAVGCPHRGVRGPTPQALLPGPLPSLHLKALCVHHAPLSSQNRKRVHVDFPPQDVRSVAKTRIPLEIRLQFLLPQVARIIGSKWSLSPVPWLHKDSIIWFLVPTSGRQDKFIMWENYKTSIRKIPGHSKHGTFIMTFPPACLGQCRNGGWHQKGKTGWGNASRQLPGWSRGHRALWAENSQ